MMLIPIGDDVKKRQFPIMTATLVIMNVFIFAIETKLLHSVSAKAQILNAYQLFSTWGMVPRQLFSNNVQITDVAALATHMFLHANFWHLLGNMIVLWAFGFSLEERYGPVNFLCMFIGWGIFAGLIQAVSDPSSSKIFIGASGAIAGVLGAYTLSFGYSTNVKLLWIWFKPHVFKVPAAIFGSLWVILQFWYACLSSENLGGVAWLMHIVGFLAGVVTIVLLKDLSKKVLVECRGDLILKERQENQPQLVKQSNRPAPKRVLRCPHCAEFLNENHRMSDQLMRCPAVECGRLIYLDSVPAMA